MNPTAPNTNKIKTIQSMRKKKGILSKPIKNPSEKDNVSIESETNYDTSNKNLQTLTEQVNLLTLLLEQSKEERKALNNKFADFESKLCNKLLIFCK